MFSQLTVSLVIFEEEIAERQFLGPVRCGAVSHDPFPVEPDAICLGVSPQAGLEKV